MQLCRAIAKFRILLRRIRIRRANRALMRVSKFAHKWKKDIRTRMTTRVTTTVEKAVTANYLFKVVVTFDGKIRYIQRTLKQLMLLKVLGIAIKKCSWAIMETEKQEIISELSLVKVTNLKIPEEIKEFYIRKLLKQRVADYHERMVSYGKKPDNIYTSYVRIDSQIPVRPEPNYFFSRNDYFNLFSEAISNHNEWKRTKYQMKTYQRRRIFRALGPNY